MGITIRKANSGDVRQMASILLKAWHKHYAGASEFYDAQQFVDPNYATPTGPYANAKEFLKVNKANIKQRLYPPFATFVACAGKKIVGYITCEHQKGGCWITDVAIIPDHQGAGIGKALYKRAISGQKKKIILWVNVKNPAIKFWKKLGFKEVLQEVLMEKKLK